MSFQIGSNLLDACVLSVLKKEDAYGYKLTQELRSVMNVSESTLYPVLRRLVTKGFLETYDKEYMGRNRRAYGYKLTQELRSVMNVSESTLYPVLRRLVTKGFLETYDKEYMGRNRRYYHLTAQGIVEHEKNLKEWDMFSKKIDTLLKEGFQ